ncbi:Protein of unknown function [Pyronema omphalodes CBS 100304]|uniref:Uncharacterized protein n=1 Tax=Pyronema omphalodes (strain CBS 100304) TaxID=1076935 RepID=U4LWF6_PYROM|nr:Protein of unknown function [Pyronema omphalodes CBS 100304]
MSNTPVHLSAGSLTKEPVSTTIKSSSLLIVPALPQTGSALGSALAESDYRLSTIDSDAPKPKPKQTFVHCGKTANDYCTKGCAEEGIEACPCPDPTVKRRNSLKGNGPCWRRVLQEIAWNLTARINLLRYNRNGVKPFKPKKKPEKVNKRDELCRELDDIRAAARSGH